MLRILIVGGVVRKFHKLISFAVLGIGAVGCTQTESASMSCEVGYEMSRSGDFANAVPALSACVESKRTLPSEKRLGYVARAWAYKSLNDPRAAAADQEAALALSPGSYHELINYALYLRAAGRVNDSLAPLKAAEKMDQAKGWTSMMTQYHIGWSFQELGRHEEAIVAFTKGIPEQDDFAYAYYRRGLSWEALGKEGEARADFEKVGTLIKTPSRGNTAEYELPPVIEKLNEYGIQ